jgi:hypothetical protein
MRKITSVVWLIGFNRIANADTYSIRITNADGQGNSIKKQSHPSVLRKWV